MPASLCKLLPFFCKELKDAQVEFIQSQMYHIKKRNRGQEKTTTTAVSNSPGNHQIAVSPPPPYWWQEWAVFVYDFKQGLFKCLRWALREPEAYWEALQNPDFLPMAEGVMS